MKTLSSFLILLFFTINLVAQEDYTSLPYKALDSILHNSLLHEASVRYTDLLQYTLAGKNKAKKEQGEESIVFAHFVTWDAIIHLKAKNNAQSFPLFQQAIAIFKKIAPETHPKHLRALSYYANLCKYMGNYDEALRIYLHLIELNEKLPKKSQRNMNGILTGLANLHNEMGNYERALPLYLQTRKSLVKKYGKKHSRISVNLMNLASSYQKLGDYEKAMEYYLEIIDIYENDPAPAYPILGNALSGLAQIHILTNNFDKALPLLDQALVFTKKRYGKTNIAVASILRKLAQLHQKMGNLDKALNLYLRSDDIIKKGYKEGHPQWAHSYNNLTNIYLEMRSFENAWKNLDKAIYVNSQLNLTKNIQASWADSLLNFDFPSNRHLNNILESCNLLYLLLEKDFSVVDAQEKKLIIADLIMKLLSKLGVQIASDEDKLLIFAKSNQWLQRNLSLLNQDTDRQKAFELSDQNKSVLLLQSTKSESVYRLGDLPDSLAILDRRMQKKKSQLKAKILEERSSEEYEILRTKLNRTNQKNDLFIEKIKKEYPKYYKLKFQQIAIKTKDIQRALDQKTALIEYVITDSILHIFYIDNLEVKWKKVNISKKELNAKIKHYYGFLSNYELVIKNKDKAFLDYTNLAYWCYQNLVAPISINNKKIESLIIVADGNLGHLPFETFLTKETNQSPKEYAKLDYLLKYYNISYNYSATLWKENMEAPLPKNNSQVLGMAANYDLKLNPSMLDVRLASDQWLRDDLFPLPKAVEEVEILEKEFEGLFLFNENASEKVFKQQVENYAIIHLAMHGVLDSLRPILSSLAFSEDNDSLESNFLQAHEISKMQLNADLVVLSACETGYGNFEQGNGIASLARAFMYAGAPSLIVSLWSIEDKTGADIMKKLYHNLAKGMRKDEALKKAKLDYIQTAKGAWSHPVFWSPFVLIGNTNTVNISKKAPISSTKTKLLYGLFTIIGLGLLIGYRKFKRE
jgi:CHAT domain-containing protein